MVYNHFRPCNLKGTWFSRRFFMCTMENNISLARIFWDLSLVICIKQVPVIKGYILCTHKSAGFAFIFLPFYISNYSLIYLLLSPSVDMPTRKLSEPCAIYWDFHGGFLPEEWQIINFIFSFPSREQGCGRGDRGWKCHTSKTAWSFWCPAAIQEPLGAHPVLPH